MRKEEHEGMVLPEKGEMVRSWNQLKSGQTFSLIGSEHTFVYTIKSKATDKSVTVSYEPHSGHRAVRLTRIHAMDVWIGRGLVWLWPTEGN